MSAAQDAMNLINEARNATISNASDYRCVMSPIENEIDRLANLTREANRCADDHHSDYKRAWDMLQEFRNSFGDKHSHLF